MLIALLTHAASQQNQRFAGQVVDESTGKPLAAAVVVTSAEGQAIEFAGKHGHVQFLRKRWCYVDGRFEVLRDGQALQVEIRRVGDRTRTEDTPARKRPVRFSCVLASQPAPATPTRHRPVCSRA